MPTEASEILTSAGYQKLLKDLKRLIEEGKTRAREVANQELVRAYWKIGKRIADEKLIENAGYGESVMEKLAGDLDVHPDTLRQAVVFSRTYDISDPRVGNLTWSHYRELLRLPKEERDWYEEMAEKEGWVRDDLVSAIRRNAYEESRDGKPAKGKVLLKRPANPTYVYKGIVMDVIDADTLLVEFNLGFFVKRDQRIRLAQIDCPPIDTPAGKAAREFVQERLARVPFVMIRTTQIDLHGRYVGDLFYSFTETDKDKIFLEGRYLNQELVDRGLAKRI